MVLFAKIGLLIKVALAHSICNQLDMFTHQSW